MRKSHVVRTLGVKINKHQNPNQSPLVSQSISQRFQNSFFNTYDIYPNADGTGKNRKYDTLLTLEVSDLSIDEFFLLSLVTDYTHGVKEMASPLYML